MKKNLVCQEELDHKIWGAVSVIIIGKNVECFLRPLISCFQEEVIYSPYILWQSRMMLPYIDSGYLESKLMTGRAMIF